MSYAIYLVLTVAFFVVITALISTYIHLRLKEASDIRHANHIAYEEERTRISGYARGFNAAKNGEKFRTPVDAPTL